MIIETKRNRLESSSTVYKSEILATSHTFSEVQFLYVSKEDVATSGNGINSIEQTVKHRQPPIGTHWCQHYKR